MNELAKVEYERSASAVMWPVSMNGRLRGEEEPAVRQTGRTASGDADVLKTGQQLRDALFQRSAAG